LLPATGGAFADGERSCFVVPARCEGSDEPHGELTHLFLRHRHVKISMALVLLTFCGVFASRLGLQCSGTIVVGQSAVLTQLAMALRSRTEDSWRGLYLTNITAWGPVSCPDCAAAASSTAERVACDEKAQGEPSVGELSGSKRKPQLLHFWCARWFDDQAGFSGVNASTEPVLRLVEKI
jgi:hypothetical protein